MHCIKNDDYEYLWSNDSTWNKNDDAYYALHNKWVLCILMKLGWYTIHKYMNIGVKYE